MDVPPGRDGSTATAGGARADRIAAERMDAASRAASALAHQFANYLGTMRAMVELLAARVESDAEAARDLDVLAQGMAGAMQLVASLRSFTHPPSLGGGACDLNAVLHDAEPALRGALPGGAALALRLAPGRLEVRADAEPLRRLAVDLVAALTRDLRGAGEVVIATGPAPDAPPAPAAARLVVRAAGRPFDREQAVHAFEPFAFDASYDGGLRLPAIYAAVTRSGGSMACEPSPDGGTTLSLLLPRSGSSPGDGARAP